MGFAFAGKRDLDSIWKSGVGGLGTGFFNATGGFGLAKTGWLGRLGFQALSTSTKSIGQNWAYSRDPLSKVTLGVGPVNLTLGRGQRLLQLGNNWGNVISNSLGLANLLTGGRMDFNWKHQSFVYSKGWLGGIYKKLAEGGDLWTGAYSILGIKTPEGIDLRHESHHIWQSRAFFSEFPFLWGLGGVQSVLTGHHFYDLTSFNFFEQQAYGNMWRF